MSTKAFWCAWTSLLCVFIGCEKSLHSAGTGDTSAAAEQIAWLDQGWNNRQRQWFYHLANQGSHLVPYDWFLSLEQADNDTLFRDNTHIADLRFLPDPKDPNVNPDGLPVGFVKDSVPAQDKRIWLGLTCSACHTSELTFGKKVYRIDGGPGHGDIQTLLEQLTASLQKTHDDDTKFSRFSKNVLGGSAGDPASQKELREALAQVASYRKNFDLRNHTSGRYGFARVDAFGIIMNEVLSNALQVPGNRKDPDAPVSYPFLWDAPQHDFVQWNGAAPNEPLHTHFVGPLARNVGEVLGVFGEVTVTADSGDPLDPLKGYASSARRVNLLVIEELLKRLNSPKWPTDFPPPDPALAAKGRVLFEAHCIDCHQPIIRDDPARRVQAVMTPVKDLGTDGRMANNFVTRRANPGPLKGEKKLFLIGSKFGDDESGADVLVHVIAGVILLQPLEIPNLAQLEEVNKLLGGVQTLEPLNLAILNSAKAGVEEIRQKPLEPLGDLYSQPRDDKAPAYKGRPLNGIWATAPYLHNGSVPNLDELLKPAADRTKKFYLGSREFDPVKVGFESEKNFRGAFEFSVDEVGNSNAGHEYGPKQEHGPGFDADQRKALIEYLKTFCDEAQIVNPNP